MIKKLLCIIFSVIPFFIFSGSIIDSLKKRLQFDLHDSERIQTLNELSWEMAVNDPLNAKLLAYNALHISEKTNNLDGEATSYNRLGLCYEIDGKLDSAILFYKLSYDKKVAISDIKGASNVLLNIGAAYYVQGYYNLALKYYLNCAKLIESNSVSPNDKTLSKVYNNIGLLHRIKNEYKEALSWYQKSLEIKRKQHDKYGLLNSFTNISLVYQNLGDLKFAELYIDSAIKITTKNKFENELSGELVNKASIEKDKKNFRNALILLKDAENWLKLYPDPHVSTFLYLQLGEIFFEKGEYNVAKENVLKSIAIANKINRREVLQNSYHLLASCNEKLGDFKAAFYANAQHKIISDSIYSLESKRSLDEQQIIYNVKKSEQEIKKLNFENEKNDLELKQSKQRSLYILSLLLVSGIAIVILIYAWLQNRKNNKLLNQKNAVIHKSLYEKELLLKEIHHRVKNNLQIINGLLELQESLHSDSQVKKMVIEAQGRIKTMSIIHELLYQSDDVSKINFNEYVSRLINSIELGFSSKQNSLNKQIMFADVYFNIDTIIPLGLILNELISNAYKYVYFPGKGNELTITLEAISDQQWIIAVKDDGEGIANNGEGNKEGSFGLKLVKMLTRQLSGKLSYNFDNGTKISVVFYELNLKGNV